MQKSNNKTKKHILVVHIKLRFHSLKNNQDTKSDFFVYGKKHFKILNTICIYIYNIRIAFKQIYSIVLIWVIRIKIEYNLY